MIMVRKTKALKIYLKWTLSAKRSKRVSENLISIEKLTRSWNETKRKLDQVVPRILSFCQQELLSSDLTSFHLYPLKPSFHFNTLKVLKIRRQTNTLVKLEHFLPDYWKYTVGCYCFRNSTTYFGQNWLVGEWKFWTSVAWSLLIFFENCHSANCVERWGSFEVVMASANPPSAHIFPKFPPLARYLGANNSFCVA